MRCRVCMEEVEGAQVHPECSLAYKRGQTGWGKAQFAATFAAQNYKCAICGKYIENRPCADHNHATGQTRGVLCTNCNILLGHAKEDAGILRCAIEYLRRWEDDSSQ